MNRFVLALTFSLLAASPLLAGYPATYVSHVSPYHVAGGALFSVIGYGFGETPGKVQVGGLDCEVVAWSNRMIRVRAPMETVVAPVTVTVAGKSELAGLVPVAIVRGPESELPTITAMTGMAADGTVSPGDVLTLTGSGFGSTEAEVTFAADPSLRYPMATIHVQVPVGTVQSWSDTEVKVVIPDTCVGESYVLISLEGFVLMAPTRVICPAAPTE